MAIVYDEGRTFVIRRDGVETTRKLRVTPYSEAGYVADLLLGGVRLIGGILFYIPPCRDPYFPWCVCDSVTSEEGVGTYTGTAASGINNLVIKANYSEGARLTVTYKTLSSTFNPSDGDREETPNTLPSTPPYGSQEPTAQQEIDIGSDSYDFSAEYLSEDGHTMGYYDSEFAGTPIPGGLIDGHVQKHVPRITLTIVRHYVIRPPWTAISQQVGCVNKSAFGKARRSWPRGTLRFDGLKSMRKVTSFGIKLYELTLTWSIRPAYVEKVEGGKDYVGWQRKFRFADGKWYWYKSKLTGKLPYEWDEDQPPQTLKGVEVKGFALLFHPRAT